MLCPSGGSAIAPDNLKGAYLISEISIDHCRLCDAPHAFSRNQIIEVRPTHSETGYLFQAGVRIAISRRRVLSRKRCWFGEFRTAVRFHEHFGDFIGINWTIIFRVFGRDQSRYILCQDLKYKILEEVCTAESTGFPLASEDLAVLFIIGEKIKILLYVLPADPFQDTDWKVTDIGIFERRILPLDKFKKDPQIIGVCKPGPGSCGLFNSPEILPAETREIFQDLTHFFCVFYFLLTGILLCADLCFFLISDCYFFHPVNCRDLFTEFSLSDYSLIHLITA